MTLFQCEVPGKPVPQGRARVTRWGTHYPKTSVAHRRVLVAEFRRYRTGESVRGPVELSVGIAGARANSDLTNHGKMVEDALVDAGVLPADDVRTVRRLVLEVLEGEARTFVSVTPFRGTRTPR